MRNNERIPEHEMDASPKRWKRILTGIGGASLALFAATTLTITPENPVHSQESNAIAEQTVVNVAQTNTLLENEQQIVDIVNQASEAVVSIANLQVMPQMMDPFGSYSYNNYFMPDEGEASDLVPVGEGSGVVYRIDDDLAYIVTNQHVIDGADGIEVRLKNGEVLEAELIGSDTLSDLAVLTVDPSNVNAALEFVNSDLIQVGQTALAIGSPLGSEFATSVTRGIVSGLDRSVPVDTDGDGSADWEMSLLQTDAAINPGNSGGALINSSGQLIGINSSKLSATGVEGMGFAIPANDVIEIVNQLEESGEVVRPVLGVQYTSLDRVHPEYRSEELGLEAEETNGAFVVEVVPGGSADEAGVQPYDLITAIDGQEIEEAASLRQYLYQYRVGDTITLSIRRGKENIEIDVLLDATVEEEANLRPMDQD